MGDKMYVPDIEQELMKIDKLELVHRLMKRMSLGEIVDMLEDKKELTSEELTKFNKAWNRHTITIEDFEKEGWIR